MFIFIEIVETYLTWLNSIDKIYQIGIEIVFVVVKVALIKCLPIE